MNDTAKISYLISEEEWARTGAMRWEAEVFPTYYCFFGRVSFRVGEQEVLGTDQFDISVADLAVGLANVVGELRTGAVGIFKFQQSDDMLEISFQADRESVTISHNLSPDGVWMCNRDSLEKALVEFIVSFTDEGARRVPDLFGWRDLEILRYFSTQHNERGRL
jgi:hypothetical protein